MRFDIFQDGENEILFILIRVILIDGIRKHGQIQEKKPHRRLVYGVGSRLFMKQRPDHVFDEVLHGKDIFCLKVQIAG